MLNASIHMLEFPLYWLNSPLVSPDGGWLVYSYLARDGFELYLVDLTTSAV
jgi:Tol biopolymer transport system component